MRAETLLSLPRPADFAPESTECDPPPNLLFATLALSRFHLRSSGRMLSISSLPRRVVPHYPSTVLAYILSSQVSTPSSTPSARLLAVPATPATAPHRTVAHFRALRATARVVCQIVFVDARGCTAQHTLLWGALWLCVGHMIVPRSFSLSNGYPNVFIPRACSLSFSLRLITFETRLCVQCVHTETRTQDVVVVVVGRDGGAR